MSRVKVFQNEEQLKKALEDEDFEMAAKLRDQLNKDD